MAIISKDELMNRLNTFLGEDTSDETLSFIEDVTDTIEDYESKSSTDWEQRYKDLDSEWRAKYRDRFFRKVTTDETIKETVDEDVVDEEERKEPETYDDLFEKEG